MIKIDTITQCNKLFSQETLHPLVSVLCLADTRCIDLLQLGFYAILLRGHSLCSSCYGWKNCDFSAGTLLFLPPKQAIQTDQWVDKKNGENYLLCFHPNLICCSSLEQQIANYSFFNYQQSEALHISAREKQVIVNCINDISEELQWGIDEFSRMIILNKIELLLNYSARFYHRQFITRHIPNECIVEKTNQHLESYFQTHQVQHGGLQFIKYCAQKQNLSPAYLEDVLKHQTGKNVWEYIQSKIWLSSCVQSAPFNG